MARTIVTPLACIRNQGKRCRDAGDERQPPKGLPESKDVVLALPTFTATADMAGISRVMGGYHIQADNVEGLKLGRFGCEYSCRSTTPTSTARLP